MSWLGSLARQNASCSLTLALTTAMEEAVFIREQIVKMVGLKDEDIKIEAFSDCNDTVAILIPSRPVGHFLNRAFFE